MPFFPQAHFLNEASLVQLLSELDQPTSRKTCGPRFARQQIFTPKFDVTEVAEAYELYGELPGLEQHEVSIEWSDAQTLVVKGKTERPSTSVRGPSPDNAHFQAEFSKDAETSSEKSHAATVEDEYDEADTPLATPATTATATNDTPQQSQQQHAEAPRAKYWVAERKVGEFARSFSFSQRVEQDFVTATLKNGVLHVVVPKSQKPKKVAVNVY